MESFCYKIAVLESHHSVLLKEGHGHYYQCFLSYEIFESGWLLIAPSKKPGTVTFEIYQILTKEVLLNFYFF